MFDFVRVSCAVPKTYVANTEKNCDEIINKIKLAKNAKSNFVFFPELSVTGYSCEDLFFQEKLHSGVKKAISKIITETKDLELVAIVGAPLKLFEGIYNCALVIAKGKILGIVPKTYMPNHNEFSEKRWFSEANDIKESKILSSEILAEKEKYEIPVGNNIVFATENNVKFGVEICEDLWSPIPPSTLLSLRGAEIIFNLSASNETIGKRDYRRDLVKQQSAKCSVAYCFVSSGTDESTTDIIFSGHSVICENGKIVSENENYLDTDYVLTEDLDLGKVRADKIRYKGAKEALRVYESVFCKNIYVPVETESFGGLLKIKKMPFIPESKEERKKRSLEIFKMQKKALKKRLEITGGKAVIGVSGGLDSTLALLVTRSAINELGKSPENILAVTMPCFGTTDRTFNNAVALMEVLGVKTKNISIKEACIQHFKDIGHDINIHDITYENTQARERTQVLMDLSNEFGGIVIGTGDLSELSLGWCTYSGDQMSMYGVNAGIPKTLIKEIIYSLKDTEEFINCQDILTDILNTPISPELLPPDKEGKISQKTEENVGPYELCDFFLYYVLRFGYSPSKVFKLSQIAFKGDYADEEIIKWEKQFYKRFFSQQFKRSCMPDGVKIGEISLSPRGGLKMPSDAESAIWLSEIDKIL